MSQDWLFLNLNRERSKNNLTGITLPCGQAHLGVTRARSEEQSDPTKRSLKERRQDARFRARSSAARACAPIRACHPTWACLQVRITLGTRLVWDTLYPLLSEHTLEPSLHWRDVNKGRIHTKIVWNRTQILNTKRQGYQNTCLMVFELVPQKHHNVVNCADMMCQQPLQELQIIRLVKWMVRTNYNSFNIL